MKTTPTLPKTSSPAATLLNTITHIINHTTITRRKKTLTINYKKTLTITITSPQQKTATR